MALKTDELLRNPAQLLLDIAKACTEESDGGTKITTQELMDAAVKFVTNMGIDVVD